MKKIIFTLFLFSCSSFLKAQVSLVKDFYTGTSGIYKNNGSPAAFKLHDGKFYLFASDNEGSNNLYAFSSLSSNPVRLRQNSGVLKGYNRIDGGLISSGSNLFFFCQSTSNTDDILYVYDGSEIRQLTTIPATLLYPCKGLSLGDGKMIFIQKDDEHGFELWVSDGTVAGTQMIKDINPGTGNGFGSPFPGLNGLGFHGKAYFMANDGNGPEVWVSDGTTAGTAIFKDEVTTGTAAQYLAMPYAINNELFLYAGPNSSVYASDGTAAGTQAVGTYSAGIINFYTLGLTMGQQTSGNLYFYANQGGYKLYKTDGSAASLVTDELNASNLTFLTEFEEELYGLYTNSSSGKVDLVKIDPAGNTVIKSFADPNFTTTTTSKFGPISVAAGKMYFFGVDGSAGQEYWESDGTTAGTKMVADFSGPFGLADGAKTDNIVFENTFVFTAEDATTNGPGIELWAAGAIVTSTTGKQTSDSYSLYPNPSAGWITVHTPTETGKVLSISTLQGTTVFELRLDTPTTYLSIETLPSGVYVVQYNGISTRLIKR